MISPHPSLSTATLVSAVKGTCHEDGLFVLRNHVVVVSCLPDFLRFSDSLLERYLILPVNFRAALCL
jgi:hypothetical protein